MKARVLADQLEDCLWDHVLNPWLPRCVDSRGGFSQSFDRKWAATESDHRFLVFQARVLWAAATVLEAYPQRAAEYTQYVQHGVDFLTTRQCHPEGAFTMHVNADGEATGSYPDIQNTYAIAFGLFGLAAAARALPNSPALEAAKATFRWIRKNLYDASHGGYFEMAQANGEPIIQPFGRYVPRKTHNTGMHLFEAFIELARCWPDPEVIQAAKDQAEWLRRILFQPQGTFLAKVNLDGSRIDEEIGFGHDVETAHLLLDSVDFAGVLEPEDAINWATQLTDHALAFAAKPCGAFADHGLSDGSLTHPSNTWWVQCEVLYGLARMASFGPEQAAKYGPPMVRLWDFIKDKQLDRECKGIFALVDDSGTVLGNDAKGGPWKSMYHDTRAYLYSARRLRLLEDLDLAVGQ